VVAFCVQAFLSVVSSVVDKLVHDVDTNVQATMMELRTMQSDKDGTAHISTLLRSVLHYYHYDYSCNAVTSTADSAICAGTTMPLLLHIARAQ
jgi:hypothetical protein